MRTLAKLEEPQVLVDRSEEWTQNYLRAHGTPDEKKNERWRHKQIKAQLAAETSGKCAYCEGKIADVAFPHVEHLKPKSAFPELAHRWFNMTTACEPCNISKRDYYEPSSALLNPYEDVIDDFLVFHADFVDWQLGNVRGEITVQLLKLNRRDLVESRIRRLEAVRNLLERWHQASGVHQVILGRALELDADEGEFTSSVWAFLERHGFQGATP